MTTFTVHQPMIFPPIYLVARFVSVNHLIFLTTDWAKTDGWHSRFKLQSNNGPMTIPVSVIGRKHTRLVDAKLTDSPRLFKKLCKTLQQIYGKYPNLPCMLEMLEGLEALDGYNDISCLFLQRVFDYLGVNVQTHTDIGMGTLKETTASQWLADLGHKIGGTKYVCAADATRKYLDLVPFFALGIKIYSQEYVMPTYSGISEADTSILDLLIRESKESVLKVLGGQL